MCQLQPINQIQVALTLETYLHGALGHLVVIQPQMQMRQVATTPYFPSYWSEFKTQEQKLQSVPVFGIHSVTLNPYR